MGNTYTQLYVHTVFAVQNRVSLIDPSWEDELYKYITGIVTHQKHKMIIVNGMPDHLHLFVGLNPTQSISTMMQVVKGESSLWINSKNFIKGKFSWQEGYGAFTYSRSQIDSVYNYIRRQKEHHKTRSFSSEFQKMLSDFGVDYQEKFLLRQID